MDAAHTGGRTGQDDDHRVAARTLDDVGAEYLEGAPADAPPEGERHARVVDRLAAWLAPAGERLAVRGALALADGSGAEPDVAVLAQAGARTAQLVVEVAETSQLAERAKADLYAAAGVARYWVVDLPAACVVEFLDPSEDGYGHTHTLRLEDVLEPGVEGAEPRSVQDLLGPRS